MGKFVLVFFILLLLGENGLVLTRSYARIGYFRVNDENRYCSFTYHKVGEVDLIKVKGNPITATQVARRLSATNNGKYELPAIVVFVRNNIVSPASGLGLAFLGAKEGYLHAVENAKKTPLAKSVVQELKSLAVSGFKISSYTIGIGVLAGFGGYFLSKAIVSAGFWIAEYGFRSLKELPSRHQYERFLKQEPKNSQFKKVDLLPLDHEYSVILDNSSCSLAYKKKYQTGDIL